MSAMRLASRDGGKRGGFSFRHRVGRPTPGEHGESCGVVHQIGGGLLHLVGKHGAQFADDAAAFKQGEHRLGFSGFFRQAVALFKRFTQFLRALRDELIRAYDVVNHGQNQREDKKNFTGKSLN